MSSAGSEGLSSLCVCGASLYSIPWVYFRHCISSLFWLRFPNDQTKLCQNITELNVTLIYYKTTCFADFRLNTWVMHCVSGSVFELSHWHYRILQDLWYYWKISQNTDHNLMVQGQVCYIKKSLLFYDRGIFLCGTLKNVVITMKTYRFIKYVFNSNTKWCICLHKIFLILKAITINRRELVHQPYTPDSRKSLAIL